MRIQIFDEFIQLAEEKMRVTDELAQLMKEKAQQMEEKMRVTDELAQRSEERAKLLEEKVKRMEKLNQKHIREKRDREKFRFRCTKRSRLNRN